MTSKASTNDIENYGIIDVEKPNVGVPFGKSLSEAVNKYKKGVFSQLYEIIYLAINNKLSPNEYYDYRLFDDKKYSFDDKKCFSGFRKNNEISNKCNTGHISGIFADKMNLYLLLKGHGLPIPETLAFCHETRKLRETVSLDSKEKMREYFKTTRDYPLFTKPNGSSLSLGSIGIKSFDSRNNKLLSTNGKKFSLDDYLNQVEYYFDNGYLIQKLLNAHPITRAFAGDNTATLRMLTLVKESGPKLHRVAWKIPSAENIADNFWRSGNIMADIDPETGCVRRVVQGLGVAQRSVDPKRISGQRTGNVQIPHWKEAVDLTLSATAAFPHVNVVGWDIAVCEKGPVIVEANDLPDLRLHQIAGAVGIYDDEMIEFIEYCTRLREDREKELKKRTKDQKTKEMQLYAQMATFKYKDE